jgi:hypothetical protein
MTIRFNGRQATVTSVNNKNEKNDKNEKNIKIIVANFAKRLTTRIQLLSVGCLPFDEMKKTTRSEAAGLASG